MGRALHCPSEGAKARGQDCKGEMRDVVGDGFSLSFFLPSHFLFISFLTHSCASSFSPDKFAHPPPAIASWDQSRRHILPPAGG